MTEDDAQQWLAGRVPRETIDRFTLLCDLIRAAPHNLISRQSHDHFLSRHVVDSLQLVELAPPEGSWSDIGSGAGFPGLVVACVRTEAMTLIEPRKLRAAFLQEAAGKLELSHVEVVAATAQNAALPASSVISARAVATLERLFELTIRLGGPDTTWLLPKGANVMREVEVARESWHASLRLVPSITEEGAMIVVARNVRPRKRRR